MGVRLIVMPYRGERGSADQSDAPRSIVDDVLLKALTADYDAAATVETITLTPDEDRQYGEWQRVAMANRHLAKHVASALDAGALPIGLLANCNALPGMLAGLQRSNRASNGHVGLIWIDAHADFNTPETSLSGMLGGMPVALASGLCLHRLRETAGMIEPIDPGRIIMAGLRDVDPLERELLDQHGVQCIGASLADDDHLPLFDAAAALSTECDCIYMHVDLDVLDPAEVSGHPLTVPGGPTSEQLAATIVKLFTIPQVCALGIASTPPPDLDPLAASRRAAQRLIRAAWGDGAQLLGRQAAPTRYD